MQAVDRHCMRKALIRREPRTYNRRPRRFSAPIYPENRKIELNRHDDHQQYHYGRQHNKNHFSFIKIENNSAERIFPPNQLMLHVSHSSPYTLSPTHQAKSNQLNSNDKERIRAIQ